MRPELVSLAGCFANITDLCFKVWLFWEFMVSTVPVWFGTNRTYIPSSTLLGSNFRLEANCVVLRCSLRWHVVRHVFAVWFTPVCPWELLTCVTVSALYTTRGSFLLFCLVLVLWRVRGIQVDRWWSAAIEPRSVSSGLTDDFKSGFQFVASVCVL